MLQPAGEIYCPPLPNILLKIFPMIFKLKYYEAKAKAKARRKK